LRKSGLTTAVLGLLVIVLLFAGLGLYAQAAVPDSPSLTPDVSQTRLRLWNGQEENQKPAHGYRLVLTLDLRSPDRAIVSLVTRNLGDNQVPELFSIVWPGTA
jgi:hypothetical protein